MRTRLLSTKLYVPPMPTEMLRRPRLVEILTTGLDRRLTLVSAPVGFGKTTLLSEWIASTTLPTSWINLDEADNDPAAFWTYFIAALQTVNPRIGQVALSLLQSTQPPQIEAILTNLINEISSDRSRCPTRAMPRYVVVLDDYHVIDSQPVHKGLGYLVEHLPRQMHIVVSSRTDPPLHLARLRARGQLNELRTDDLRFTVPEVAALLNERMGLGLSGEDVAALEVRTEGWVASLRMAAISMQGMKDVSEFVRSFSGSHRHILDYLTEEVLRRQEPETQAFLMRTSILERLTGSLCDALTGRRDGQAMLEKLDAANMFLVPLDQERRWYRYHVLFGDLLRKRLGALHPRSLGELHHKACLWLEHAGLTSEAVQHALAARDFDRAARLIERVTISMVTEGKAQTLLSWLSRMPEEVVSARPWLCVWGVWASLLTGKLEQMEPFLKTAESAPNENLLDRKRVTGHVLTLRAILSRAHGDPAQSIQLSQEATKRIPKDDLFVNSLLNFNLAVSYFMTGEMSPARQHAEKAIQSAHATAPLWDDIIATSLLGDIEAAMGQLHRAEQTYQRAIEIGSRHPGGQPLPVTANAYIGLSNVMYQWDRLEEAARFLERGIQLGEMSGEAASLWRGHVYLARLKTARHETRAARQALDRLAAFTPVSHTPEMIKHTRAWRARIMLEEGDLPAAERWAVQEDMKLEEVPLFHLEQPYLTLVRLHLAKGEVGAIPRRLDQLAERAEQQEATASLLEILVLQALALQTLGMRDQASQKLGQALSLAEAEGFVRIFLDEGEPMAKLLRIASSRGISPKYAGRLLAALECTHEARKRAPEGLSERESEIMILVAEGLSNREIAERLCLAVGTVKKHVYNIYDKLDVRKRTQAVARARDMGLL
jgi:LuxR family maltose regulon positive regulatory protein